MVITAQCYHSSIIDKLIYISLQTDDMLKGQILEN